MLKVPQQDPVVPVPTTAPVTYFTAPNMPHVPTMPAVTTYQTPQITVPTTLLEDSEYADNKVAVNSDPIHVTPSVSTAESLDSGSAYGDGSADPRSVGSAAARTTEVAVTTITSKVGHPAPAGDLTWSPAGALLGLLLAAAVVSLVRRRGQL